MYKVNSNGNVYFADTVLPVIVADNGCYILSKEDTGGVVAKISAETEDGAQLADKVFRTREDGLRGTEPLCTYEQISGAPMMEVYESALHELGVETEEVSDNAE